jgi:hypothetical protein
VSESQWRNMALSPNRGCALNSVPKSKHARLALNMSAARSPNCPFHYRPNVDGTVDSISAEGFLTVGLDLSESEVSHSACSETDLQRRVPVKRDSR